jgi:inosose dehydratase
MDRREFVKQSFLASLMGLSAGSLACTGEPEKEAPFVTPLPNPVGYHAIGWPREQLQDALDGISSLGFPGIQMLGWVAEAYAGDRTAELKDELVRRNLEPVALSSGAVSLDPGDRKSQLERCRRQAEFLKALGGQYLQLTDAGGRFEGHSAEDIQRLGGVMNEMGKIAQDFGLTASYHPHIGSIGEQREGVKQIMDATDPSLVKLQPDVAHLTMGNADPAEIVRTYRDRLLYFHFKDVREDQMERCRTDFEAARKAKLWFCELGEGVVNFPAILEAIREVDYRGWLVIEIDAYEPRDGSPLASARLNRDRAREFGLKI